MGRQRSLALTATLVGALIFGGSLSAAAQPSFPALTGRVIDGAGLLSAAELQGLVTDLEALEAKSSDQLVVVTLKSLQGYEIEEFGYRLGRHWGIGVAGKDNGVLLIVAPNERKVRIEVGRGLEPVLTDATTKIIIENAILPRFRGGDFPAGIRAGVADITAVLLGDAQEVTSRAKSRPDADDEIVTIIVFMIWLTIFGLILWNFFENARSGIKGKKGGGGASSSGSGWSGGSGGGFSGGGGGFGGGGSSGSW